MKITRLLSAALASLFLITTVHAKIWHVNNNPGVLADFTTLQAANNDAMVVDGDTLYVAGSATSYGSLVLNKELTIIGPGYFLDENPATQAVTETAKTSLIFFNTGSDGSVIAGLDIIRDAAPTYAVIIGSDINDITLKKNRIQSDEMWAVVVAFRCTDILITQNYIVNSWESPGGDAIRITDDDEVVITNNYIERSEAGFPAINASIYSTNNPASVVVRNNVIKGDLILNNTDFRNNILMKGSIDYSGPGNTLEFNMANGSQLPAGSGNINNVDMSTVFRGSGSTDCRWQLATSSPAIDRGDPASPNDQDGTRADMGMFGSSTPYVLSGLPEIPAIFAYAMVDTSTTSLTVNLSIKSHFPDEVNANNIRRLEWFFIEKVTGNRTPSDPNNVFEGQILVPSDEVTEFEIDISHTLDRPAKEYHMHIYAVDATGRRSLTHIDTNSLINDPSLKDNKKVSAKIFLEGPYDVLTGEMTTYLNASLPLSAPYPEDPRTVTSIPADVVDWVLVELREVSDGPALASHSALLRKDGRIVPDDGTTGPITLSATAAVNDFFIVVKHRNHLSVMSESAITLSNTSAQLYDFTDGTAFGTNPMKEVIPTVFVMRCGDGNDDGGVDALDRNTAWRPQNGSAGYLACDFNLDGGVDALDLNMCWRPNNGQGTQVP